MSLVPASVPVRACSDLAQLIHRAAGWKGEQGQAWARRNPATVQALDASYMERFGFTRTTLNLEMLEGVDRTASVLEVGCSHGAQLNALHALGFTDLQGVDLSEQAMLGCRWPTRVADGASLPFGDRAYDLVMVSGTLMHVPPDDKARFVDELKR